MSVTGFGTKFTTKKISILKKNNKANHGDKGRQEQEPTAYVNGTAAAVVAEFVLVCAWRSAVLRRRVEG